MSTLQIFKSPQFGQVRLVEVNRKTHFVAADVAKALGYANPNKAINDHCRWVTKCYIPHPQSITKTIEVNVIPEGDIYRLVSNSELPGAEKFESWIFDEVLPQIRQTGGYIPTNENDSDEDILAKALLIANKKIELKNKELVEKDNQLKEKDKQLEEQKPKVIFAEALEVSENSILIGELAKILRQNGIDIGQNRLFEWLRQEGYLIKKKGESYNLPTQYSMDLQLFEIKKRTINNPDGSVRATTTTKVTGKGQIYFVNKFKEAV